MNKRRTHVLVLLALTFLVILLVIWRIKLAINEREIKEAIHGVVIVEELAFYKEPKQTNVRQIKILKKSDNVYILDEFEKDGISWYKIKVDGKINGYVYAKKILKQKKISKFSLSIIKLVVCI